MKKLLKKLNTKREGATLITVVIATAFLIAIGVVILSASTRYLVSVYMDRNSNENLYDAEGILAEVRTGLLEYAGEAGAAAYQDIVENYEKVYLDENNMPLSAKDRFARLYICGIIQQLEGGNLSAGITKAWPSDKINELSSTNYNIAEDSLKQSSFSIDNLKCLTSFGDAIKTKDMLGSVIAGGEPTSTPVGTPDGTLPTSGDLKYAIYKSPTKGYFLTIHNLVVDYTNPGAYRSTIQTDIQLMVPDYKFDGDDTLDAANKFLIISDGKLEVNGNALRSVSDDVNDDGVKFNGSIYTGGNVVDTASLGNSGIIVQGGMAAHFSCEMLISRGSLDALTGSKVDVNGANEVSVVGGVPVSLPSTAGDIYLKNIRLLSNGTGGPTSVNTDSFRGTNFSLKANAYIENDLDIRDAGATVTLGGKYYGYSYSEENDPTNVVSAKSQSDYSSAILVNGIGTCLQSDPAVPLSKLLLAGRTYVSRGENQLKDAYNDIMMGESLAVKSNQIAYMVPDKYVIAKHNPVSSSEAGVNGDDYFDPLTLVDIEAMKADENLWKYLDHPDDDSVPIEEYGSHRPVTGNYGQASTTTGDEGYVFLYLNFKDQLSANQYFKDFYNGVYNVANPNGNEDDDTPGMVTLADLTQRARAYITTKDAAFKFSPELYLIAGNIVHNYEADGGPGFQEASYFDADGKPSETLLNDGKQVGVRYVNLQKYLTTSGDASSMRLVKSGKQFINSTPAPTTSPGPAVAPLVSSVMIKTDKITAESSIALDDHDVEPQTGAKVFCGLVNDLTIDDTYLGASGGVTGYGRCLVVNKGNVTIGKDCAGLIIADGNVTVNNNFRGLIIATGDVTVGSTVTLESDEVLVNKLMTYAKSHPKLAPIFGISDPETHNTTIQEDCCRYLNWVKNTY